MMDDIGERLAQSLQHADDALRLARGIHEALAERLASERPWRT